MSDSPSSSLRVCTSVASSESCSEWSDESDDESSSFETPNPGPRRNRTGFNMELGVLWLEKMCEKKTHFYRPLVTSKVASTLWMVCDVLKQDTHVFATAVKTLERYLHYSTKKQQHTHNPFLTLFAIAYMAGKLSGDLSQMHVYWIARTYREMLREPMKRRDRVVIREAETHVLKTLRFALPVKTEVDDLTTVLYMMVRPLGLTHRIEPLCDRLMRLYLIHRQDIYERMLELHSGGRGWRRSFLDMVKNRYLLPLSIIACSLKILRMKEAVDVLQLIKELGAVGSISGKFIKRMACVILETYNLEKNENHVYMMSENERRMYIDRISRLYLNGSGRE